MLAARSKSIMLFGCFSLLLAVLTWPLTVADAQSPPMPPSVSTVQLMLVLAWDGRELEEHNLDAIKSFRSRFQDMPVLHLLSPAYFTRPGVDPDAVRAKIRSAMQPKDQVALLLGNWRSLATASGVIFRSSPTFWGSEVKAADCAGDCGIEVPVNIYPAAELDKLLATSLEILTKQGFGPARAVAIEGWVASPEVLEAAYRAGLRYDLSAVSPELLNAKAHYYPLYRWAKALWPQVTPHTQPYKIHLSGGDITEMPQALASVDYLNYGDVTTIFKEYAERVQHQPDTALVLPLVLYQATAYQSLPLLSSSLQDIFSYAQSHEVAVTMTLVPDLVVPAESPRPPFAAAEPVAH